VIFVKQERATRPPSRIPFYRLEKKKHLPFAFSSPPP